MLRLSCSVFSYGTVKNFVRQTVSMEWVETLPDKIKVSLESLLDTVEHHEETYMQAQNASVGQIWVAMALMNRRIQKLEEIVSAQRKALNEMDNADVDKHIDRKLEESLKKY